MEKNTLESALKEFSQTSGTNANDVKEFFALMSDGSIKRMPKEDMASVLGGLLSSQKLFPFMYRGIVSDFNSATEPGYYNVSNSSYIPNEPDEAYRYGSLLVFGTVFVTQIYISDTYNIMYIRNFFVTWRSWKKYSPTT